MDDRAPKELARRLVDVVSLPQSDIARVLRVAPRTLQRWVSESDPAVPSRDNQARLRAVAGIVSHLWQSFTGPGTFRWVERRIRSSRSASRPATESSL